MQVSWTGAGVAELSSGNVVPDKGRCAAMSDVCVTQLCAATENGKGVVRASVEGRRQTTVSVVDRNQDDLRDLGN